jgi:hypothetical protein
VRDQVSHPYKTAGKGHLMLGVNTGLQHMDKNLIS